MIYGIRFSLAPGVSDTHRNEGIRESQKEGFGVAIKLRADCPICGSKLIKAAPSSDIEIDCPKCKSRVNIIVGDKGYHLMVLKTADMLSAGNKEQA